MHWTLLLAALPSTPLTIWLARHASRVHPTGRRPVWFLSALLAAVVWHLCCAKLESLMAFGCDDFYSYGEDRDNANRFGLAGLAIAAGNFAIAGLALAILPAAGPAESAE